MGMYCAGCSEELKSLPRLHLCRNWLQQHATRQRLRSCWLNMGSFRLQLSAAWQTAATWTEPQGRSSSRSAGHSCTTLWLIPDCDARQQHRSRASLGFTLTTLNPCSTGSEPALQDVALQALKGKAVMQQQAKSLTQSCNDFNPTASSCLSSAMLSIHVHYPPLLA
jgi:hypothetical protein